MKPEFILKKVSSAGILLVILTGFAISCDKFEKSFDFDRLANPVYNPELALPLINSSLKLQDFYPDSAVDFFRINDDSSISLIYNGEQLFSQKAENLVKIPDQDITIPTPVIIPDIPAGMADSIDIPLSFQFITEDNGQIIDSLIMKSGLVEITGSCNLNKDQALMRLIIPEIQNKSTGQGLALTFQLNNPGGGLQELPFSENVNLEEYKMVFDNENSATPNQMNVILRFVVFGDQNPNLSPYDFQFSFKTSNITFSSIYGYLSFFSVGFSDSIDITAFDKNIVGGLEVGQDAISIKVNITNSMGLPIEIEADTMWFYSDVNPPYYSDVLLFGQGIPNVFDIGSPDYSQIGQSVSTPLEFKNNNIEEAFKIAPKLFYYNFNCNANPANNPDIKNFLLDQSALGVDVYIQFDLFALLRGYSIQDTVVFDFDEDVDELDYALFRLNILNGFPFNSEIQVYFTDENYVRIDSLITDNETTVIEGAPVSGPPDYKVTGPASEITDVMVSSERFEKVKKSEFMLIKAKISTTEAKFVKLYTSYSIGIKVGIIAGLNLKTEN